MSNLYLEIEIKDESYRKIGTWKFAKKDACKRLKDINSIFGLGLTINESESSDSIKKDKDLDWLK
jgi:hypothetical protein